MNLAFQLYKKELLKILKFHHKSKNKKLRILDLGCGDLNKNPLLNCGFNEIENFIGVDAFDFKWKSKNNISFIKSDIWEIENKFEKKSFDVVFALDLIEHLKNEDGEKLIDLMKRLSKLGFVIFTPNGFVEQFDPINSYNCHLSGWSLDYFKSRGFDSKGIYGLKYFRKEFCELKSPKVFYGLFSLLSNLVLTKWFPQFDYAILHHYIFNKSAKSSL